MVTTRQLRALGLTRRAIGHRVEVGRLSPVHRGVYRDGPVTPPLGLEWAAVLACGDGAVLSHRSAAALWGLLPADPGVVDLIVPKQRRPRRGVRPHVTALDGRERRTRRGLPVTSPARTLADLERVARYEDLHKAAAEALFKRLISDAELLRLRTFARRPAVAKHVAEQHLVDLVARAGLPAPRTNVHAFDFELDLYWPAHRLVVELDGFDGHGHRLGFERDRRKDLALAAQGIEVLRVTWAQIAGDAPRLTATLAVRLSR